MPRLGEQENLPPPQTHRLGPLALNLLVFPGTGTCLYKKPYQGGIQILLTGIALWLIGNDLLAHVQALLDSLPQTLEAIQNPLAPIPQPKVHFTTKSQIGLTILPLTYLWSILSCLRPPKPR